MKNTYISEVRTELKGTPGSKDLDLSFSVNYYDRDGELALYIFSDYSDEITIFSFKPALRLELAIPFLHSWHIYEDINQTIMTCKVPAGKNFFEEDFSVLNSLLGFEYNRDFIFNRW
jgi:hypothetical protein